ncbi:MAG: preprotein translocase subunit SecG [Gemmatimonadales bacterium]|jgi:preprotein translocase subunit SecG|nr:MAG: preprotein translocase subunit SecG [Gemmatimonadales bacterium]
MYGFLLAILILDGLFLGVVILLQSGKGGGLAAMGGSGTMPTDGIMGGRQATNLLTRATWTSGTLFMVLALVLSIMSSRASAPQSILRPDLPQSAEPVPVLPGLSEEGSTPAPTGETGGGDEGDTGTEGN